ncbi:hypothetical protein ACQP2F_37785 [Actinoplanes sp. CA-030573]|uniref:hypothetical protein n=1 Tax=Actinoplanes sp. CA-030573 TaxID=3239898 RepID=UPI003D8D7B4A
MTPGGATTTRHLDALVNVETVDDYQSMVLRVAVVDPLPFFRLGVMAAVADAGYAAEETDDVVAWAAVPEARIALLTVKEQDDWATLDAVCRGSGGNPVIALLDQPSLAAHVRALAAGAVAALPRDAAPDLLREVFAAAAGGKSLLPTEVLRALLRAGPDGGAGAGPTADELSWLRQLARGASVAEVAGRSGYSERMMFRLLRDLYGRLGTRNRTEALIHAKEQGWL